MTLPPSPISWLYHLNVAFRTDFLSESPSKPFYCVNSLTGVLYQFTPFECTSTLLRSCSVELMSPSVVLWGGDRVYGYRKGGSDTAPLIQQCQGVSELLLLPGCTSYSRNNRFRCHETPAFRIFLVCPGVVTGPHAAAHPT